jgi:Flp pilus assembly protein TadG
MSPHTTHAKNERGYILITTALLLAAILAISGLSFDIGRMYVARNEAQAYADAAALSAAKALNGTLNGINSARSAALAVRNRYNFNSATFTGTTVEFGTSVNGPWAAAPASGAGVAYARVIATAPTNIIFLRFASGVPGSASPAAVAIAGQVPQSIFTEGLFPFSPFTVNNTPPHFGLQACPNPPSCDGAFYALRWPPGSFSNPRRMRIQGGSPNGNVCPGDFDAGTATIDKATAAASDIRGYYGPFGNASVQREAIINDEIPAGLNLTIGTLLPMNGGGMQTQANSIAERVLQDTDSQSRTYAQYLARLDGNGNRVGNGRRVIGTPLNSGPPDYRVEAIAGFFLLDTPWYNNNGNQPICAEYIGPFTLGAGSGGAAGTSGSYSVRLVL